MPPSETPTNPNQDPDQPGAGTTVSTSPQDKHVSTSEAQADGAPESNDQPIMLGRSTSRYVDYDSHELLEKISQYEDERRWQRIREGIWISIILHIFFFSALTWIPRYVFNAPTVIDPFDAIKKRKDLTYLDELPDAIKQLEKSRPKLPALKPNETTVDKKTLDALKALQKTAPPPPDPAPKQEEPPPPQPTQQPPTPAPLPPSVATPQPNPQIAQEIPRSVPARPNFSLGPQNPADQLRQAMRDSAHSGPSGAGLSGGSLNQHPSADGGAEILSDTQGINFGPYMQKVIRETYRTWDPLIPEEVNPPINKRGEVEVVFTILPNGRLQAHAMTLTGRSGDVALDRAAWGAIEGADYPPLPREFHGPFLQLRFRFQYNIK